MKSVTILFVGLLMLVRPLWPICEYIVNYEYIANVLCENKDRPELQCDGKCYLSQMLAEESKQSHQNPFSEVNILEMPLLFHVVPILDFKDLGEVVQYRDHIGFSKDLVSLLLVFEIIHPPEVS